MFDTLKRHYKILVSESVDAYIEGRYDLDPEARRALETLGLPLPSSFAEVRRHYLDLARDCHPDSGKRGDAQQFLEIKAAYDVLKSAYQNKEPHE